jgi:hypothetical protein
MISFILDRLFFHTCSTTGQVTCARYALPEGMSVGRVATGPRPAVNDNETERYA